MFTFKHRMAGLINMTGLKYLKAVTSGHFINEIPVLHPRLTPINRAYPLCVMQYAPQTSHFNPFCLLSPPLTLHVGDIDRWTSAQSNMKLTVMSAAQAPILQVTHEVFI